MGDFILAEEFPVGEHLADELEARGWTQADFAEVLGRPSQFVSEVINGKKEITRDSAAQIAAALGTSPEYWLNIQDSYRLWRQSQDPEAQRMLADVRSRAAVQDYPVKAMRAGGFVTAADPAGVEREVLALLGKSSWADPGFAFAARRSNADQGATATQAAWAACVRARAQALVVGEYSPDRFADLAATCARRARHPEGLASFAAEFAEAGVRLVHVPAFTSGKIDGCAMLVEGDPVIGVSGRGKRLDKVLFTILHECAHVVLGHLREGEAIVDDLDVAAGADVIEREADELAEHLVIPVPLPAPPKLITRVWVDAQADRLEIHPIVVVGRLQKRGVLAWRSEHTRSAPMVGDQLARWSSQC